MVGTKVVIWRRRRIFRSVQKQSLQVDWFLHIESLIKYLIHATDSTSLNQKKAFLNGFNETGTFFWRARPETACEAVYTLVISKYVSVYKFSIKQCKHGGSSHVSAKRQHAPAGAVLRRFGARALFDCRREAQVCQSRSRFFLKLHASSANQCFQKIEYMWMFCQRTPGWTDLCLSTIGASSAIGTMLLCSEQSYSSSFSPLWSW